MKKKSPPYAIIGAAILGIIAIVLIVQWQKSQDAALNKAKADAAASAAAALAAANNKPAPSVVETPTDMKTVLYATQPVEPGITISPAFYEKKLTPTNILPDAYTDKSDATGWVAIRNIEKGDPLTPRNVGKGLPYMSQRISPGMRMISLPIFNADANSTGGFVVDGDKVDLLYTHGGTTQLALQNVKVAYVPGPQVKDDQTTGINPAPAPTQKLAVTFEVTPEEAQMLVNLTSGLPGTFSMILRSRKDTDEVKIKPFNSTDLQGNFKKLQQIADKSSQRVNELEKQIEAQEKADQGNTNEISNPPPPSP